MSNEEPPKADILQGTLDLMVLHTLDVLGPLHGYAIAARLEQVSGGAHRLNMGTLYPGLMRLESTLLEAHQSGIKRAHVEPMGATGNLLESSGNCVAVQGSQHIQRVEDHEIQSSLQDVGFRRLFVRHTNGVYRFPLECQIR